MPFALPLAHTGHALVDLAIYLAPVAIALTWLGISNLRERRRRDRGAGPDGRKPEPPAG